MEQQEYIIQTFYPTPIYATFVNNLDDLLEEYKQKEFQFSDIGHWGKTHKLAVAPNSDIISDKKMNLVGETIDYHLRKYCTELGFEFTDYNRESWLTSFERGEYAHVHDHGDADISGCLYYETNGSDGNIFFESPSRAMATSLCYRQLGGRYTHQPMVGKLLLFPGWLLHGVTTNETDNIRRSLSFNISFVRPKL